MFRHACRVREERTVQRRLAACYCTTLNTLEVEDILSLLVAGAR